MLGRVQDKTRRLEKVGCPETNYLESALSFA